MKTAQSRHIFSNLDKRIVTKKFSVSAYDRRDSFPFSIVGMLYLCRNTPSKIFYVALRAEVLRIARTETETFKPSCTKTICRMMKQGGTIRKIKQYLCTEFSISRLFSSTSF